MCVAGFDSGRDPADAEQDDQVDPAHRRLELGSRVFGDMAPDATTVATSPEPANT